MRGKLRKTKLQTILVLRTLVEARRAPLEISYTYNVGSRFVGTFCKFQKRMFGLFPFLVFLNFQNDEKPHNKFSRTDFSPGFQIFRMRHKTPSQTRSKKTNGTSTVRTSMNSCCVPSVKVNRVITASKSYFNVT